MDDVLALFAGCVIGIAVAVVLVFGFALYRAFGSRGRLVATTAWLVGAFYPLAVPMVLIYFSADCGGALCAH